MGALRGYAGSQNKGKVDQAVCLIDITEVTTTASPDRKIGQDKRLAGA